MLLTRLRSVRVGTRRELIHKTRSTQCSSFHTSSSLNKMTPKQKRALLNNPVFAGMEKARHIEEQRAKQGDATKMGTRMVIKSTNEMIDFSLPPLTKPAITTKEFWLYPITRIFSSFKSYIFMPIRMYNYLKKAKKRDIKDEVIETYKEFNKHRAAGSLKELEEITSGKYFQVIAKETRERTFKPDLHFQWSCENLSATFLSLRFISIPSPAANFVQVVYKFSSDQKVEVVNKAGTVVGGAPARAVIQYFGFEKDVDREDSKWLIVEELTHPQSLVAPEEKKSKKTEEAE